MVQLPRDEAQRVIYRGCARLAEAMKIKRIAKDAEQKWEDEMLREMRVILAAAMNGPLTDLIIPPLPIAFFEVHKRLNNVRPIQPSDIHAPFEQAGTSPWAVWITHENDPQIPHNIDLGDPGTFWWKDLPVTVEDRTTRKSTPARRVPSTQEMNGLPSFKPDSDSDNDLANLHASTPPLPTVLRSKRSVGRNHSWKRWDERVGGTIPAENPDESGPVKSKYRLWSATKRPRTVVDESSESGESGSSVELKRRLRSAIKRPRTIQVDESESDTTTSEPGTRPSKRYIASGSSEDEDNDPYVYVPKCDECRERNIICHVPGLGHCACTPCRLRKRRCSAYQGKNRAVTRSTRAPSNDKNLKRKSEKDKLRNWLGLSSSESRESEHRSIRTPFEQEINIGSPSSGQKRVERAESSRRSSHPSGSRARSMGIPSTSIVYNPWAAASPPPMTTPEVLAPTSESAAMTATPKRVLVDKCIATENQPLEKLGPQEAEFIKDLVSLILEVMRTQRSGPLIPRTVSASAGAGGSTRATSADGEGVWKGQNK